MKGCPIAPPQFINKAPGIKNDVIRNPAIAADAVDIISIIGIVSFVFLKEVLYPIMRMVISKKTLAAVNPRK
jgi:hypothetical protein